MSGSLGLNKRFEEAVRLVVGDEQFVLLKKCVGWSQALNEFDKVIKTGFNGDITKTFYVTFPKAELEDDLAENLTSNCWAMTGYVNIHDLLCWTVAVKLTVLYSDVLQDIFKPIIEDILRLVDGQVKDALYKRAGKGLKVFTHMLSPEVHSQLVSDICIIGHLPCWWLRFEPLLEGPP